MRRNGLVALATSAIALASAVPAHAQSWRADIGINGGGSWYSPLLSSGTVGGTGDDIRFRSHYLTGAQLGLWFMPRIGIRANGTYTDTPLKQGNGFTAQDNTLFSDVNLWSLSGDLLFRFKRPAETMTNVEALPYLALGLGRKWIDPAEENLSISTGQTGIPLTCDGVIPPAVTAGMNGGTCTGPAVGTGNSFFLTESPRLMGLVGLGTDLRLARSFGLRLEVGDRMYKPEVLEVTPSATFAANPGLVTASTTTTDNVGKLVHEVYGQIGLHLLLGVAAPPVVAMTPAPAPPPPEPTPVPPPAPTTTTASVCVVDPTLGPGLRTETATLTTGTNDTTVMVNGTATPLRSAFTGVPVASSAQWYIQGQPLFIGTGRNALAYVSFGSVRNVDAGDLIYLGTVDGLPVYANKTDATSLTMPNPPVDITCNGTLMTGLRNLQVLYVPVTAYGCSFQPIQLQQAVRKVRG